jgi:threonine dehydrogenase-like Zn-dependent dehydrogenase
MGGVRDGHVRLGDTVLISGLGAIGLMAAAQAARLSGAYLVAVSDPIEKRRNVALANGADIAFDPTQDDIGLLLRDKTNNIGCDVVIETSGSYKAIEQGIRALAYGGNLACVGWLKECHTPINLGYEGHFNQTKIIFSRACSEPNNDYPRWNFNRICHEAWQMLNKGLFQCKNIIDPIIPFEKSDEGYIKYIVEYPELSVKMGVIF